jgi:hypothetical protein
VRTLVHIDRPHFVRSGGSELRQCRVMVQCRLYQFSTRERDKNKARKRLVDRLRR